MTGKAWISYVPAEDNLFRLMWIFVALEAAAEFVVGFAVMALAAERDDLPVCRRVTIMAILTGYLGFVGAPFGLDVSRSLYMAFGAVGAGESNCRFCRRRRCCLRSGRLGCGFGCYCYRSEQKQG
jgi:hypothetical protein